MHGSDPSAILGVCPLTFHKFRMRQEEISRVVHDLLAPNDY